MKTQVNPTAMEQFVHLTENLSLEQKLELITLLTESVKTDIKNKKSLIRESVKTLKTHEISENILQEIRNNPMFSKPLSEF